MANSLIRGEGPVDQPAPEKDTQVFMYRKGEARLFAAPEIVPEGEGWQDTPVPDDAPGAAPQEEAPAPRKKKHTPVKAADDGDSG